MKLQALHTGEFVRFAVGRCLYVAGRASPRFSDEKVQRRKGAVES